MDHASGGQLTVAVIIPAHNEEANIGSAVTSVLTQSYPVSQLLVVDDNSTDRTAEATWEAVNQVAASTPLSAKVQVLRCVGGSKAKAQNFALPHVETDVVIAPDADTVLARDAVEHLVGTIGSGFDGTCGAVFPNQQRGLWARGRTMEYALSRQWWKPVQQSLGRLMVLSGAINAYRVDVLRKVGGYPDFITEDIMLTWMLYSSGHRLSYTRDALAYTLEPVSFSEYWGQARRWSAGYVQTLRRRWRDLSHPARFALVFFQLWDSVVPLAALVLISLGLLPSSLVAWVGGGWAVLRILDILVATTYIGPRRALTCFVPYIISGEVYRLAFVWTFLQERVLGKHYGGWTGRHGMSSMVSPATPARKLTGLAAALCSLLFFFGVVRPSGTSAVEGSAMDDGEAGEVRIADLSAEPAPPPANVESVTAPPDVLEVSPPPGPPDAPLPSLQPERFSLAPGHWYGAERGDLRSHSGYGGFPEEEAWGQDREAIRKIQQRLVDLGRELDVDGLFGVHTRATVVAFQREHGLVPDGLVGPVTWRHLFTP